LFENKTCSENIIKAVFDLSSLLILFSSFFIISLHVFGSDKMLQNIFILIFGIQMDMKLIILDKSVFKITGNISEFLDGLTANVLETSQNAFLDIHGKIVATFDQVRVSNLEHWIVFESCIEEKLQDHLAKYLLLADVEFQKTPHKCYFDPEKSHEKKRG